MADYDVFISYHWRDHSRVEPVARELKEKHGLKPFLDRWYLVPGQSWPEALQKTLRSCRAVAVFIGPGEMGPWQQREMYFALERQAKDPSFPVIPVLLPGSDPVLGFLSQNTWVDLREQPDAPEPILILALAVRREPPSPELREQLSATMAAICPYRGLLYFREEDAPFFFGRDTSIHQLTDAIKQNSLLAVVGPSGSGKSSVVRAGLVPALRSDNSQVWEIATILPRDDPLRSLAVAFMPFLEPQMTETDRLIEVNKLAKALLHGNLSLADVLHRVTSKQSSTGRLLLVVDQWEELYTLTSDESLRRTFIDQLLDATSRESTPLTVVLTLRGDFVGKALAYRPFCDRMQGIQINLGPMIKSELETAITSPAAKVGLGFESGLVERILEDAGDEPGNLPLLEFVLKSLWENRRGSMLHHDAYKAMGYLQGAVAKKADNVFSRLSPLEQEAVHRLFLCIVRPSKEGEDTRRRAHLAEIDVGSREVVKKLADERLLVTSVAELGEAETIEVAHEALIHNWGRLRAWINEDREFLLWRDRLRTMLMEWLCSGRDEGVLLRGPLLVEAEHWLIGRSSHLTSGEVEFITLSSERRDAEARKQEEQRQHELAQAQQLVQERQERIDVQKRLSRNLIIAVTLLAILSSALLWFYRSAKHATGVAVSRQLAIQASRDLPFSPQSNGGQNYARALLEAVHAVRVQPTIEARSSLLSSLLVSDYSPQFLWGHQALVTSVAFSPNGKILASAGEDSTVVLWDVEQRIPIGQPLQGHQGPESNSFVSTFHFSVVPIVLDKDQHKLTGLPPKDLQSVTVGSEPDFVLNSGGKSLTSPDFDNTSTPRDVEERNPICIPIDGHQTSESGLPLNVAFSPDGKILASAGEDGSLLLWDVEQRKPIKEPFKGHQGRVTSVAFSPDGKTLASAGEDGSLFLWDVEQRKLIEDFLVTDGVSLSNIIAFSPDRKTLACAGADNSLILWEMKRPQQISNLLNGHQGINFGWITSIAFSPDGKILASASLMNGTLTLWDVKKRQKIGDLLNGHPNTRCGLVGGIAFSPDGKILASISFMGSNPILWDVDLNSWVSLACRMASRNLTHKEWNEIVGAEFDYEPACPDLPVPQD